MMNIAETILMLASARGSSKTICPSEVARELWPNDWQQHMEEIRIVAFNLRDDGQVIISQQGKLITGKEVKGPIRIRIV